MQFCLKSVLSLCRPNAGMFVSDPDGPPAARPRFSLPPAPLPAPPQDRVAWVDVAKGLTILLVVVFHAQIYLAHKGLGLAFYTQINTVLQPVRMPLFFAVSGLLAVSLIRRDWRHVLQNRVGVFLLLFALWSAIHIAAFKYLLWPPLFAFEQPIGWEVMQGLVHPRTSIWFIWALAFYILFAKSLQAWPAVAAGLSLALGILGASGLPMAYGFGLLQQKLLVYLPFFVLPALYGRGALAWIAAHPLPLLMIGAVLSAVAVLAAAAFPLEGAARDLSTGMTEVLRAFGGLCAGLAGAVYLARWRPPGGDPVLFRTTDPCDLPVAYPVSVDHGQPAGALGSAGRHALRFATGHHTGRGSEPRSGPDPADERSDMALASGDTGAPALAVAATQLEGSACSTGSRRSNRCRNNLPGRAPRR